MTVDLAHWTYELHLGEKRIARLSGARSFEAIASLIKDGIEPAKITFTIDEGYVEPVTGCLRPVFAFPVDREAGDAFYNGALGYRAEYYRSSEDGERANRFLIDLLLDELLMAAHNHRYECQGERGRTLRMHRSTVEESLRLPSAKVWPAEDKDRNPQFHGIVTNGEPPLAIEIRASRWLHFAEMGITRARKGLRAPEIAYLEIKGGFETTAGEERIPESKILRSCEIHMLGFT